MAELFDIAIFQVLESDGSLGAGWKLNFYVTGTSTRKDTYPTEADADAGINANANPVVADANGRFGQIWLTSTGTNYKAVLTDEDDVVVATRDPAIFSVLRQVQTQIDGYATRTAIKALTAANNERVYLTEAGREGAFVFDSSDLSTEVTADTLEGIYLAPDSDATGASGAWVRQYDGPLNVKWFGATGDGATDDTAEIQAAVDMFPTDGGALFMPTGTYIVSAAITFALASFKPMVVFGAGGTTISSSHDGIVFDDSSKAIRVENIKFSGPGLANTSAFAIQSALTRGSVRDCEFAGYRVGVDCSGATNPVIERNRFTLCQEGIRCTQTSPAFANILSIRDNYLDFNSFGIYLDQVYGATLENNAFEQNTTGLYCNSVRLIELSGTNWFESNTTPWDFDGSCTGVIGQQTRLVTNTNPPSVVWGTSKIIDRHTPDRFIGQRTTTQTISNTTDTNITFDNIIEDQASIIGSPANTLSIRATGWYQVSFVVEMASFTTSGGEFVRININKNASALKYAMMPMVSGEATRCSISCLEKLAAGDVLRAQVYQNSGGNLNLNGGTVTQFSVELVDIAA